MLPYAEEEMPLKRASTMAPNAPAIEQHLCSGPAESFGETGPKSRRKPVKWHQKRWF